MPISDGTLRVAIQHRAGALRMNVAFETSAPWTILFGPSGSGKTTVLRAIAGFLLPESGFATVEIPEGDPIVLFDRAAGLVRPPHRRPVRTAAQRTPLFPHRTVRDNVAYGAEGRSDLVQSTLDRLQLQALAGSSVERLSGGEQQRVAIARAVAAARATGRGTWLLLDEPFAGLDVRLRSELTRDLRGWLGELGHPVLSVTHDVSEVFALRASVVRLAEGRVVGSGWPEDLLREERDRILTELTAETIPDQASSAHHPAHP